MKCGDDDKVEFRPNARCVNEFIMNGMDGQSR